MPFQVIPVGAQCGTQLFQRCGVLVQDHRTQRYQWCKAVIELGTVIREESVAVGAIAFFGGVARQSGLT